MIVRKGPLVGMLVLSVSAALTACVGSPQVVYYGSTAFNERVDTFAVTPYEAAVIAGRPYGNVPPAIVVDRHYVFGVPQKRACVSLEGTYVNGDTGTVEHRTSDEQLCGGWATFIVGYHFAMPKTIPADAYSSTRSR